MVSKKKASSWSVMPTSHRQRDEARLQFRRVGGVNGS